MSKPIFWVKVAVALGLFVSLFYYGKIDPSAVVRLVSSVDQRYFCLVVALICVTVFLGAQRWQILAKAAGLHQSLMRFTQFSLVGFFFNMFLPTSLGGDVSRAYYLSRDTGNYKSSAYSVLADRVIGISVLFVVASVALLASPGGGWVSPPLKVTVVVITLVIFAGLPYLPRLCTGVLGRENWLSKQFNSPGVQIYWNGKKVVAVALFIALVLHTVVACTHIALGYALGITSLPSWFFFFVYPCVAVLSFVVPSLNGIGIREWGYTYLLTTMGVSREMAVGYALAWFTLGTLLGAAGGLVYLLGHFEKAQDMKVPTEDATEDARQES